MAVHRRHDADDGAVRIEGDERLLVGVLTYASTTPAGTPRPRTGWPRGCSRRVRPTSSRGDGCERPALGAQPAVVGRIGGGWVRCLGGPGTSGLRIEDGGGHHPRGYIDSLRAGCGGNGWSVWCAAPRAERRRSSDPPDRPAQAASRIAMREQAAKTVPKAKTSDVPQCGDVIEPHRQGRKDEDQPDRGGDPPRAMPDADQARAERGLIVTRIAGQPQTRPPATAATMTMSVLPNR